MLPFIPFAGVAELEYAVASKATALAGIVGSNPTARTITLSHADFVVINA